MDFPRHLLELEALTRGQIEALLSLAARFKRERAKARTSGESPADRRALLRCSGPTKCQRAPSTNCSPRF